MASTTPRGPRPTGWTGPDPCRPDRGPFHILIFGADSPDDCPVARSGPPKFEATASRRRGPRRTQPLRPAPSIDGFGLDFILIVLPPDEPRWAAALRDRIRQGLTALADPLTALVGSEVEAEASL